MRNLLGILFVILSVSIIQAQSFEFRVLANKGQNTVKAKGSDTWKPVKTGSTLFAGSEVKVSSGGYLGLMHKSGKTMEIKTATTHKIDELSKSILTKGSSVASQYGEFLLAKMNKGGDGDVSASKLNNLNVTGAVSRATGDDAEIQIFLPKTSKILGFDDTRIKWKELDSVDGYKLTVDNLFSETIAEKAVDNNVYDLSQLGVNIEEQGGLFLRVMSKGETKASSSAHAVELITGSKREEILNKLTALKGDLTNDDVSLNKLILAIFYEENKLFLHAFSCYHEVLEEYPEVDFYKSAYLSFVERNKDNF